MPNDTEGCLVDGSIVITSSTDTPPVSVTRDAATGAVVIDLKKTPAKGINAVLCLPTKPTSYTHTLTCFIEESDVVGEPTALKTWQAVGSFPIINAMLRVMDVVATVAFTDAAVGTIISDASTSDGGVVVWFDPALKTIGGKGKVVIAMSDGNDVYATPGTATVASSRGAGTFAAAALIHPNGDGIPGRFVTRFISTKRYVRLNMTASGGSWGLVSCYLQDNATFPIPSHQ
jgi:hypothetical protein